MKILIIFIILLLLFFNYSSFGATYTVPIGKPFDIPLKDTSGYVLPVPITDTPTGDEDIIVKGYNRGVVNYSGTKTGSVNEFPSGIEAGFFTSSNPTTNCITQYDADRRGMVLTDFVNAVCAKNGFGSTTSNTPCTDGNIYTCNDSFVCKVSYIGSASYNLLYNSYDANGNLLQGAGWYGDNMMYNTKPGINYTLQMYYKKPGYIKIGKKNNTDGSIIYNFYKTSDYKGPPLSEPFTWGTTALIPNINIYIN